MSKKRSPNIFKSTLFLGIFILSFICLAGNTNAQSLYDDSINAVVTPENPLPKGLVSISLDSPLVPLGSATVSWFVNGKKISEGKDMRIFEFILPASGTTKVGAHINSANFGLIVKNFSFAPNLVEIIYEASSYTPPFYKGKALIPPEGVVTLFAMPNFIGSSGSISPKNLIFTWKKNGSVDGDNSGLGKNTYVYNNGRLPEDAPLIEVAVTSLQDNSTGFASFRTESVEPEIIFYEDNPLLGVELNQEIGNNFFLSKQEMTLIAYPYYFGGKNKDAQNLEYSWLINGILVPSAQNSKTNLTVRKPDGKGSSSISLSIENSRRIFQTAKASIIVEYGN